MGGKVHEGQEYPLLEPIPRMDIHTYLLQSTTTASQNPLPRILDIKMVDRILLVIF